MAVAAAADHNSTLTPLRLEGKRDMTAAELEVLDVSEAEAVLHWRFGALVGAGYAPDDALLLSSHLEIDLHLATDLVRRGCPADTAVRILL